MQEIGVKGRCGNQIMYYKLTRPYIKDEFWQIYVNGVIVGSLLLNEDAWHARVNPSSWLGEYEMLIFIELIKEKSKPVTNTRA